MKRLFTGLCMAWGNFCFIPGLKKWDENARSLMLGWLPLIGVVIGGLWALIYFGLVYASLPYLLVTFIMAFLPFFLSGFIHVDGFMDCNDAMLSRGTLEKKQSILKDSRCGTFAVVTLIFTALCFYSSLGSAISYGIDFVNLIAITAISRSVSGLEVLISRPMATSQYAAMAAEYEEEDEETSESCSKISEYGFSLSDEEDDESYSENAFVTDGFEEDTSADDGKEAEDADVQNMAGESTVTAAEDIMPEESKKDKPASIQHGVYLLVAQLILVLVLVFLFCKYYLVTAFVVVGTALGTLISCSIAKKSLGGMNGDIAGYSIIWGEMIGVILLALV